MAKKEFSKFLSATVKRTAQNVYPLVRQKARLIKILGEAQAELESILAQIDSFDAPIKEATGGYGVEDLVVREVTPTGKFDKNGKEVKTTSYKLKYPETLVPEEENLAVDDAAGNVDGQEGVNDETLQSSIKDTIE